MSMNELIKVNYDNSEHPTVSGRELHEALGIESNYTTWFKRMCEYGFSEGKDFATCFPNLESENQHGGQNKTDHTLTLDMAKELCMIQRSEIGKRFREYFIEVEKAWNDPVLIMGRAYEAQKAVADKLSEKVMSLENKVETDAPKVLFADSVTGSENSMLIGDMAKLLKQNGVDMGQKRFFEYLRNHGYLMKTGVSYNMPTQRSMELGIFEVKERTINNPDGSIRVTRTTKVTGKGQLYFINLFLGKKKEG